MLETLLYSGLLNREGLSYNLMNVIVNFSELASQVVNNKIKSIEHRSCPDQYVGRINDFDLSQNDFPVRYPASNRPDGINCLIMVIESPHLEEFSNTPCPANGKTGELIRKWIVKVVGLQKYRKYGLILVNAIQHQCSLGAPTRCFRDDVFCRVWNNGGETDFIYRLKNVYRIDDIVVNCCTKGNSNKIHLRSMVQVAICNTKINCDVLRRTHPSSWYSAKKREFEW